MTAAQVEQPLKLGFSGTVEARLQYVVDRAGDSFAYAKVIKDDGVVMANLGTLPEDRAAALDSRATEVMTTSEAQISADGFTIVYPVASSKGKLRGVLIMVWDPSAIQAGIIASLLRDSRHRTRPDGHRAAGLLCPVETHPGPPDDGADHCAGTH